MHDREGGEREKESAALRVNHTGLLAAMTYTTHAERERERVGALSPVNHKGLHQG